MHCAISNPVELACFCNFLYLLVFENAECMCFSVDFDVPFGPLPGPMKCNKIQMDMKRNVNISLI